VGGPASPAAAGGSRARWSRCGVVRGPEVQSDRVECRPVRSGAVRCGLVESNADPARPSGSGRSPWSTGCHPWCRSHGP
jgi:hypothetical protein